MRVFVTGASGFIGRAVVQELLSNGHQVLGLARSDKSAELLRQAGAEPHQGDLEDLDSLSRGARAADGVIHLAFIHEFADFDRPAEMDRHAIEAMAKALAGTNKPLVIASGTIALKKGVLATETTPLELNDKWSTRAKTSELLPDLSKREGIRGIEVRLPPPVHDKEDWGYVPIMMRTARKNGFVGYVGDGLTRWPSVHRLDAAVLFRLALENGVAGAHYHAVAEQAITSKDIVTAIGKKLDLPTKSLSLEDAKEALGFVAEGISTDNPTSSSWTQSQLGWHPVQIGLLEDIEKNYPADI